MRRIILISAFSAASLLVTAQTKRYVKNVSQSGNGLSWNTASNDLQAMINAVEAAGGGEIWVAAGTYEPNRRADDLNTINGGDCNNAFVLKPDRHIYGGFAGNETKKNCTFAK